MKSAISTFMIQDLFVKLSQSDIDEKWSILFTCWLLYFSIWRKIKVLRHGICYSYPFAVMIMNDRANFVSARWRFEFEGRSNETRNQEYAYQVAVIYCEFLQSVRCMSEISLHTCMQNVTKQWCTVIYDRDMNEREKGNQKQNPLRSRKLCGRRSTTSDKETSIIKICLQRTLVNWSTRSRVRLPTVEVIWIRKRSLEEKSRRRDSDVFNSQHFRVKARRTRARADSSDLGYRQRHWERVQSE